jgi:hypothetical protein
MPSDFPRHHRSTSPDRAEVLMVVLEGEATIFTRRTQDRVQIASDGTTSPPTERRAVAGRIHSRTSWSPCRCKFGDKLTASAAVADFRASSDVETFGRQVHATVLASRARTRPFMTSSNQSSLRSPQRPGTSALGVRIAPNGAAALSNSANFCCLKLFGCHRSGARLDAASGSVAAPRGPSMARRPPAAGTFPGP